MPVKPQVKNLTATSAQIFNNVRANLGEYFQSIVPMANADMGNSRDIGAVIMANPELSNAFLSALINRIGRVVLTSKEYSNPWADFKKGLMEYGETVEEIFVNIAEPHTFDPVEAQDTVFKRTIPDVKSAFHTMNYQKHYDVTISNDQLRQAFLSSNGITDLIAKIIDSLYTSANYDEFITMKYLLGRQALKGAIKETQIPELTAGADDIMEVIKATSNDLEFLRDDYNIAQVSTSTQKEDQYLIMNTKFNAKMDVKVLAMAFNMEKAEFLGHQVLVDSFGFNSKELQRLDLLFDGESNYQKITEEENKILKAIPCMLIDRDFFMVFDNFNNMTEQYNGKGLYWNYWYHVWKTFSISPFANATLFSPTATTIENITVSPETATLSKGATLQMSAKVTGTGFVPQGIIWSIEQGNTTSTITPAGLLIIDKDEPNSNLTIKATSIVKDTVESTATITIV